MKVPKYNLYKLVKSEEQNLEKKLKDVGLVKTSIQKKGKWKLAFYMSTRPKETPIWWTDLYKEFLVDLRKKPKNKSHFGVLLLSSKNLLYAVSLGKSHFYLKEFCNMSFGIKLAERIANPDHMKSKKSKLFGSIKNQSIVMYNDGSEMDFDSGESAQFLKTKSVNAKKWGETVRFGQSVQFTLKRKPMDLPGLLEEIEQILKTPAINPIPHVEVIAEADVKEQLDKRLVQSIIDTTEGAKIEVQEASLSGVEFIFTDYSDYAFLYKGRRKDVDELSLFQLRKYVDEKGINLLDEINRIKVIVMEEHVQKVTKPIKYFLDYVDEDNYCLIEGVWYKFNQEYLEHLRNEVDKITLEMPNIHFSNKDYTIAKAKLQKKEQAGFGSEDFFNELREKEGYVNLHRHNVSVGGYPIEFADLAKDSTLYFVKIGIPQKLSYVIDQANRTLRIVQRKVAPLEYDGKKVTPKEYCLWIILDRKTPISKLSEIESLNFLMKLVDWSKEVRNAGYIPVVRVGYKNS